MAEIVELLAAHGAAVVLVFAFLEQIGAPVPAIPVLMVAGAVAAVGGTSISWLVILAVTGAMVADTIWFFLGRRHGLKVLGLICRISLSPDSCVRQTETFFDRWGMPSLLVAKFVPGFSVVAPPLAGALPRVSFARFALYDFGGALIWSGVSIGIGVVFHDAIERVLTALEEIGGLAVAILLALFALYFAWKWWERHRLFLRLRMARISGSELRERISHGAVILLDVRHAAQRLAQPATIPGAIHASPEEIEDRIRHLDPEEEIVLFCT